MTHRNPSDSYPAGSGAELLTTVLRLDGVLGEFRTSPSVGLRTLETTGEPAPYHPGGTIMFGSERAKSAVRAETAKAAERLLRAGHIGSLVDLEVALRANNSCIYLVAGPLYEGVSTAMRRWPSAFTYMPQSPDVTPEYSLRTLLHDPEAGDVSLPDGVSYEENLSRLAMTGVVVDLVVRD